MMEAPLYSSASPLSAMARLPPNTSSSSAAASGQAARSGRPLHIDPFQAASPEYPSFSTSGACRRAIPGCSSTFSMSQGPRQEQAQDVSFISPRTSLNLDLSAQQSPRGYRTGSGAEPSSSPPQWSPSGSFSIQDMHSPILKIRRAPSNTSMTGASSIPRKLSDLSIDESLGGTTAAEAQSPPPQRRHRRRSTGTLLVSEAASADVPTSYPLARKPSRSSEDLPRLSAEAAAVLEDVPFCDERRCSHHHHRQSSISTISIKCSESSEGSASPITYVDELESSITFEPMPVDMLVPLVDRPGEMADLLAHPTNKRLACLIEHAVGRECYRNKCLPLWTKIGRDDVSDVEWLRQSKGLLMNTSNDGRMWREFCGMVGWDEGSFDLEEHAPHGYHRSGGASLGRRRSSESLGSSSSHQMNIIKEEEEEEEEEEEDGQARKFKSGE